MNQIRLRHRSRPLAAAVLILGIAATTRAAPEPRRSRLDGLRDEVTVRRDSRGIPYLRATNEWDLFFGQGYVTASDRLWQMELLRRTATGELAEILGSGAVEDDKRRRIYGFAHLADDVLPRSSPEFVRAVRAYAAGVNAYMESHRDSLPQEFRILEITPRPWKATDSILIGFLFAEDLSTTWRDDLARERFTDLPKAKFDFLFPTTSPLDLYLVGGGAPSRSSAADDPAAVAGHGLPSDDADESRLAASNNWVASGTRTITGKPMLANDPHLAPSAPSIWHMVNLQAPAIHVAGVTTPGVPGVLLGHNESIAWGATNLTPDVQDLYRESFDPQNRRRYQTPTGWRGAEVRTEEIRVRSSPSITLEISTTRHGPIVAENNGARYALRWTALDRQQSIFDAFYWINRAGNWSEFVSALRRFPGPTQNFVYADRNGNIGYYGAGQIPIRRSGDGTAPHDGSTDRANWTGFIPFAALPHLFNPPSGLIVTANQRVAGPQYSWFLGREWFPPYRARRIYELLAAKEKLSYEDFRAAQADVFSRPDHLFATELLKVARAQPNEAWHEIEAELRDWNGFASSDSQALPLVVAMRSAFWRRILEAAVGAERAKQFRSRSSSSVIDRLIVERPPEWLPSEFSSYESLLLAAYNDARAELRQAMGSDPSQWTWGRYRQYRFPHPLAQTGWFAIPPIPSRSGGSSNTVNAGGAVSMRFIADLSDWDRTRQGITLGESGDPASPHWNDQLDDWLAVTPRVFPFSDASVKAMTNVDLILAP